jgi:CCR4-NOT transcriptional regulation complex NOT5 subunit
VLNIEEEPRDSPKNEDENAFVTTGVETTSAPTASEPKDVNGTNDVAEAAAGEKRKAEDPPAATNGASAPVVAEKPESEEPVEKKARVEDVADEPTATEDTAPNGKQENGKTLKKEKKVIPPVGKTARKTRSQGPVEV